MRSLAAVALLCWSSLAFAAPAPSHQAAAEQLFDMMGMEELLQSSTDTMLKSQMDANPMLADYEGVMREFLGKYLSYEALRPDFVTMYTDTFTEPELRDMIAFYQTPTGKKAVEALPRLQQQGAMLGQQKVADHTAELEQMIMARALELMGAPAETPPVTPVPEPTTEKNQKKKGKGE